MKLLSHRGYWQEASKKNSQEAIIASFQNNWGIETDLRDFNSKIVISHDMATESSYEFEWVLEQYKLYKVDGTLALNVKADGILQPCMDLLAKYEIDDYYFFDMSIPETIRYKNSKANYLIRHSEYEVPNEALYKEAVGVWLDAFINKWYDEDCLSSHLALGKKVAIVSPELHGRSHQEFWNWLKDTKLHLNDQIDLCTDLPLEAKEFFGIL